MIVYNNFDAQNLLFICLQISPQIFAILQNFPINNLRDQQFCTLLCELEWPVVVLFTGNALEVEVPPGMVWGIGGTASRFPYSAACSSAALQNCQDCCNEWVMFDWRSLDHPHIHMSHILGILPYYGNTWTYWSWTWGFPFGIFHLTCTGTGGVSALTTPENIRMPGLRNAELLTAMSPLLHV